MIGGKICANCQQEKPLDRFKKCASGNLRNKCTYCMNYKTKADRRQSRYGITPEQQEALRASQNYQCAICEIQLNDVNEQLDHSHKSGKIRNYLCRVCNIALGHFDDEPERMERAAQYVRAHQNGEITCQ